MAIKVWVFPMLTRDIMIRIKKNDERDGKCHVFFVKFNMLKNSVLYHLKINPFYQKVFCKTNPLRFAVCHEI